MRILIRKREKIKEQSLLKSNSNNIKNFNFNIIFHKVSINNEIAR